MFKKILFLTVLLLGISQVNCYADDNINFLTPNDKETYINIVNKAHSQKKKILIDKATFEDITIEQGKSDKPFNKSIILYINPDEINNVLIQGPNNFQGSLRKTNMYSGIGLSKIGYNVYSKYFNDVKVTYEEPVGNCLVLKPELLYFNYRYEERGKIKSDLYIYANLAMTITVFDRNKEVFQKVYKANHIEFHSNCKMTVDYIFSTLASKAMNNAYQKNIQDLAKLF